MRNVSFVILITLAMLVSAEDSDNWRCVNSVHKEWVSSFQEYWDLIGTEFETRNPALYQEFKYLINEQKNSAEMNQITLDYLIDKHRSELKTDGTVNNVAPVYGNYQNQIFRELMELDKYNELFRANRSYEHVEKMPNFQHLQKVTLMINSIQDMTIIKSKGEETLTMGQQAIIGLQCPVADS